MLSSWENINFKWLLRKKGFGKGLSHLCSVLVLRGDVRTYAGHGNVSPINRPINSETVAATDFVNTCVNIIVLIHV